MEEDEDTVVLIREELEEAVESGNIFAQDFLNEWLETCNARGNIIGYNIENKNFTVLNRFRQVEGTVTETEFAKYYLDFVEHANYGDIPMFLYDAFISIFFQIEYDDISRIPQELLEALGIDN